MIRSAFILVGVMAVVFFSCLPPRPVPAPPADLACLFRPVQPAYLPGSGGQVWRGTAGRFSIDFLRPEPADRPELWGGPLHIVPRDRARAGCEFNAGYITAVFYAAKADLLLVISRRGEHTYIDLVEPRRCLAKDGLAAFTSGVEIEADLLTIRSACDCPEESGREAVPCSCEAGRIYRFDENCEPQLLPEESQRLTRQELGVDFIGRHQVVNPGGAGVRLAP